MKIKENFQYGLRAKRNFQFAKCPQLTQRGEMSKFLKKNIKLAKYLVNKTMYDQLSFLELLVEETASFIHYPSVCN
jgi:hypothetical protein